MNNRECAISVLAGHREARQWSDDVVADDLLNQLGLEPDADAKNPAPVVDPDEVEVSAAEAAAKEAGDKAKAARAKLDAKIKDAKKDAKAEAKDAKDAKADSKGDAKDSNAGKDASAAGKVLPPPPAVGGPGSGPPGAKPV